MVRMLPFLHFLGHPRLSGSRAWHFDPKPLLIASLLRFSKSQEFSGYVSGEIFQDIAILKFEGPKRSSPRVFWVNMKYLPREAVSSNFFDGRKSLNQIKIIIRLRPILSMLFLPLSIYLYLYIYHILIFVKIFTNI